LLVAGGGAGIAGGRGGRYRAYAGEKKRYLAVCLDVLISRGRGASNTVLVAISAGGLHDWMV
jgi:hypothetical protein